MIALPVGRQTRRQEAARIAAIGAFVLAAITSAVLLGFLLGRIGESIGSLARAGAGLLGLGAAIVYATSELTGRYVWVPQRHWQIPQAWGTHGGLVYAVEFGGILGAGFLTYVPFGGYYVVLLAALAIGDALGSSLVLGAYGLARTLPVILAGSRMRDIHAMHWGVLLADRLNTTARSLWWVKASALLLVAVSLLLVGLG